MELSDKVYDLACRVEDLILKMKHGTPGDKERLYGAMHLLNAVSDSLEDQENQASEKVWSLQHPKNI